MFKRYLLTTVMFMLVLGLFSWLMWSPYWRTLWDVGFALQLIHREYVNPEAVTYRELREKALRGTVENLDPYSRYFSKEDFQAFQERSGQKYVGVGIEIQKFEERVVITTVFPGSPAETVGVLPGDQIRSVDGQDLREASVAEVSDAIRGVEGGTVRLGLFRPLPETELAVDVVRAPVKVPSVYDVALSADGIGYLRLDQFGDRTAEEFAQALDDLEARGMRALIIDVRNNPGGYLTAAKEVAGQFLERGELIVYTAGREGEDRVEYRSEKPARAGHYPVAVLINSRSASGSEIVAGVLQDIHRATIVGEKSYGKGSVQTVYSLRAGGAISQTTALYYFPSGASIHQKGVIPDIDVEIDGETQRKLQVQQRHAGRMSPAEFERLFGFMPELPDSIRQAAEEHLRAELAESERQVA